MKQYLIALFLAFSISGCVTADQDNSSLYIQGKALNNGDYIIQHYHEYGRDGLTYRIFQLKPNSNVVMDLFYNIFVDDKDSAIVQISTNHLVTLAVVENENDHDMPIKRDSLSLPFEGKVIDPILPHEFPRSIRCINWKGNLKMPITLL
jgi:hypothetical protein